MRVRAFACFSAIALALTAIVPLHAKGADDRLSTQGIGDIRIGMTLDEMKTRFGARLEGYNEEVTAEVCAHWTVPAYPGLGFMMLDGELARIEVRGGAYKTLSGAQIGMTEQAVFDIYGDKIKTEIHPYSDPDGKYLVFISSDKKFGMILETLHGKVMDYRIGLWDAVQLIEGCS